MFYWNQQHSISRLEKFSGMVTTVSCAKRKILRIMYRIRYSLAKALQLKNIYIVFLLSVILFDY